jgi:hypothetical protein
MADTAPTAPQSPARKAQLPGTRSVFAATAATAATSPTSGAQKPDIRSTCGRLADIRSGFGPRRRHKVDFYIFVFLLFFSDAKFKPAATHALTQPRTSAEGARSVLPVRWGRSDSCPPSPTTRRTCRHPAKPARKSTGEGACHQMPGVSRCPVPLAPALEPD